MHAVKNEDNQLITEHDGHTTGVIKLCVSPTDCMTFESNYEYPFSATVDDNVLVDKIEVGHEWYEELFGCASDGIMKQNACDAHEICDRRMLPRAPQ